MYTIRYSVVLPAWGPPHHHVHTLRYVQRALSPTLQSRSRGSMSGGGSGSWCKRQEGTAVDFQRVISSEGDRNGGEAMAQRDAGSQPSRVPQDQGEGWRWCWMPWRRLGSLPVPLSPRSKIPSIGPLSAHLGLATYQCVRHPTTRLPTYLSISCPPMQWARYPAAELLSRT